MAPDEQTDRTESNAAEARRDTGSGADAALLTSRDSTDAREIKDAKDTPDTREAGNIRDVQEDVGARDSGVARVLWWKRWLGLPGPPKYRVGEIAGHAWRNYILWPQAWFHLLIFGLLVFAFWINAMNYWVAVIDDAYITFRFSDHFIHGQGLVYNLGQRVEGFTNFTWMVILGVVIGLQGDPMFWAKVLGFVCCVLAMVAVAYFGSAFSRRRDPWNWIGVVPLAASAHFSHWSMMGLETQLQVALLAWTYARFYVEMRDGRAWNLSPVLAALAAMTRIESLYYMTPLAGYALVQIARGALDWRRFLRWGLWAAVLFVPYFVWKYTYFGDLAPNTYYAKKVFHPNHDRGITHIAYFFLGQGGAHKNLWFIPLVIGVLWWRPATLMLLGPLVLNVFYVYHVDGDWMPNLRFLQVGLPFLGMLLVVAVRWVQKFLHDWRGTGLELPEDGGRSGVGWVAAEAVVFGAWIWLLFYKAEAIFAKVLFGSTTVGDVALLVLLLLLALRWTAGWHAGREPQGEGASGAADSHTGVSPPSGLACPAMGDRFTCVAWMGLEWAMFLALGAVAAKAAPILGDLAGVACQDLQLTAYDLGLLGTDPGFAVRKVGLSSYTVFYVAVAILGIGWLIRFVSRGRYARSLVRWPVYAGLGTLLVLAANVQFGINAVYIFGTEPNSYDRQKGWASWDRITATLQSGFSPPLQNVADWMLENCQRNTTIFMSDIGYPMWLNWHMSVIDVDGLVDRVIADAPGVRGNRKSLEDFIEEEIRSAKLRRNLPPEVLQEIEKKAQERLEEQQKEPGQKNAIAQELIEEAKLERPLEDMELQEARRRGTDRYRDARWKFAASYVLRQEPEYMNIFLQHRDQGNPKSEGWPYPDISREVYNSEKFKDLYVEVGTLNKYFASWNHLFRRKDVGAGVPAAEKVERWTEGIRRNPRMPYLYLQLAQALVEAGKSYEGEPRDLLHEAVNRFRGNESFLNQLAQWGREHGDDDLALSAWKASLALRPEQDWLYRQIVEFHLARGQFEEALDTARTAIATSPLERRDVHLLGLLTRVAAKAAEAQRDDVADHAWKLILSAEPTQDWLYRQAAEYYVQTDRIDAAINTVKTGMDRCPGMALPLYLATLFEQADHPQEAEDTLETVSKKNPQATQPLLELGALRERRGDNSSALEAYEKALSIDPANAQAKAGVERLGRRTAPPVPPSAPPPPMPSPTPGATPSPAAQPQPGSAVPANSETKYGPAKSETDYGAAKGPKL